VNADALAGLQALSGGDRKPDVVIADPPRTGLGRGVAAAIAGLNAARVVLVGCDPAAFARDAGALAKLGYRLASVHAIDLFPQTDHVEAVGVLERD
jgi:tRNA/tmRNA/rRNA uracil-C5-methylase (TrmA/RlmC/RlmD family)